MFNLSLKFAKHNAEKSHRNNKNINVMDLRKEVARFNKIIGMLEPYRKELKITNQKLGDIHCLHLQPADKPKAVILYLHGGGYILDLKNHTKSQYLYFTAEIAANCQSQVWIIDYRIAPEHPYPAAIEDAYSSYLSLLNRGISAKDIMLMGDSAGGGLTLALLMKLRDDGKPSPRAAVTLSPWTDLALTGTSINSKADVDPMLTPFLLTETAAFVVPSQSAKEPYISPFYGNFEGLPPLMIVVGGRETLYDDSIRIAEKAKLAGVNVTLDINDEMFHVYPTFGGIFKEGKEAIKRIVAFYQLTNIQS